MLTIGLAIPGLVSALNFPGLEVTATDNDIISRHAFERTRKAVVISSPFIFRSLFAAPMLHVTLPLWYGCCVDDGPGTWTLEG